MDIEQEIRVIKSPILAKKLLKLKYEIVDLKRNKFDSKLTVFVFECNDGIDIIIEDFIKARENRKIENEKLNKLVCF